MRKAFGYVLLGLGVFALVLTALLPTVVADRSKKLPLDVNVTLHSSGTATVLDASTLEPKQVNLKATQIVRSDSKSSDGTNTVMFETLCIVIVEGNTPDCVQAPDPRLLSATTDRVAVSRKTAEAVNIAKYNEQINGKSTMPNGDAVRHEGVDYTWPIGAQKKTYMFFQPDLNKAFPATYQGTDKISGLTVYKYVSDTGTQPYKVQGLLDGTYTDTRTVWVEPQTGVIIKGTEHQVQRITDVNDPTGPGTLALDATLGFDQSAINTEAKLAKDGISKLRLVELWLPLITGILGVAAIVGAYFLLRSRRPAGGGDGEGEGRHNAPTPDDAPNYNEPPVWAGSSQT
jgi:hypothetical protein